MRPAVKKTLLVLGVIFFIVSVPSIALGAWWVAKASKIQAHVDAQRRKDPTIKIVEEGSNMGGILFLVAAVITFLIASLFVYLSQ